MPTSPLQPSMDFRAQADFFRSRALNVTADDLRQLLLHLSQTWETMAQAWDDACGPPQPALIRVPAGGRRFSDSR